MILGVIDGRYEPTELLGIGTSGSVWAARQRSVDRLVAVKLLAPFDDERFAVRFDTEARVIARLNHPNIITLFDYGFDTESTTHYMVTEYVDGPMLAEALFEPMSLQERVRIARDIARALNHAHAEGVLHRDLKPENVLLTQTFDNPRSVKVLDFGLARILENEETSLPRVIGDAPASMRLTHRGEIQGTPAYMSPEQARGDLDIGPATDIYALGVVLFELLEGQLPFFANDPWKIVRMQITEEPRISEAVPAPMAALLSSMLAKEPADRPAAEQVIRVIDEFLEQDSGPGIGQRETLMYGDGFVLEEDFDPPVRAGLIVGLTAVIVLLGAVSIGAVWKAWTIQGAEPQVIVETVEVVAPHPESGANEKEAGVDGESHVSEPWEQPGEQNDEVGEVSTSDVLSGIGGGTQQPEPASADAIEEESRRSRRPRRKRQPSESFETIKLKL